MHRSAAFSQAVEVPAGLSLLFVGGQNGVDESGRLVGDGADVQSAKALENVRTAVEAVGGSVADIVKWTVLVTDRAHIPAGVAAFQAFWDADQPPPAITVQIVAGVGADPTYLVEVEAVAALAR
jgi:enamine deaminase RidA (YjgF/YER057c/UK114 family)